MKNKQRRTKIVEVKDNSIVVVQVKGVLSHEVMEMIRNDMKNTLGHDKIILIEDDMVKYKFIERKTDEPKLNMIESKLNEIISYLYENRH